MLPRFCVPGYSWLRRSYLRFLRHTKSGNNKSKSMC
jgi:hypothetical protein